MDWVQYIKENSDKALSDIYRDEKEKCLAWLGINTNLSENDKLEIFQVAVVILYDNVVLDKLKSLDTKLSTYLIAICKNKSREYNRAQRKYAHTNEFPLLTDHIDDEIQEKKEHEQLLSSISKLLTKMGDPCKSILQLFYYKKMSMENICQLMGYNNVATTKNQKYKCMKRLQKLSADIKH